MEFSISPATGVPIYQQLTEQICAAVARGQLRADQRLPSVRELSQTLVVNPNTIARAYNSLERDGVLYTRPGLGVFVAKSPAPLARKARRERLISELDRLLVQAVRFGFTPEEFVEYVEEQTKAYQWRGADADAISVRSS
jgi:GntR family transcriptional regulator